MLPFNDVLQYVLFVVVLFDLITFSCDSNTRAVIHRCGFKFKTWINRCTVGQFTAFSQSCARSR